MGMGGRGRRAVCHSRGSSVGSAAVSLAFAFVEQPWPARTAERGAAAGSVGADGYDEYEYGDDADAEDAEQQGYLDAAAAREAAVRAGRRRARAEQPRETDQSQGRRVLFDVLGALHGAVRSAKRDQSVALASSASVAGLCM
eukprot:CAMPEP_0185829576 /NCGR_PEP_ID=MMETSP1353-20130828/337_1 /TAXON_ID=1077150 /ORGANISM="Erythrolobus australicus, Strain CCMP3124" /LENGTH=141 /DNA_ID=CAMNT_0028527389 /DNA_START=103 /DNA_END=527 /DNA_ORIENTATION=+